MPADAPLFDPADFMIPPGITHVCAGGETPVLHRHSDAVASYFADKCNGMHGRDRQMAQVREAQSLVARLFNVKPEEIGFVSSVAEGISMIVESLDWREGDNICVDLNEYPSIVAPFAMRANELALRLAQGQAAGRIADLVDSRTRLIAVSEVSYLNGERFDLAKLRRAADDVGALLVVDYTQAAGYLPIVASVADFAFSACYKWLLGITGAACAFWNQERQPNWRPTTAGWHSIAAGPRPDYAAQLALQPDGLRFTRGNPAHASVYVLNSALGYLGQFQVADVQTHVQTLTVELRKRLTEAGIPSSTPSDPRRHGASICIDSPRAREIVDGLFERGVCAWNGRGRIRFSFHGFNCATDVDAIMRALLPEWEAHHGSG